jgi:aminomethyltransferase
VVLRRTALFERHLEAGARMVAFAGWELPLDFGSIAAEHRAVREAVGVFDVSHMGQLRVEGSDAHAALQRRLSNDLDRIAPGQAQYTLLTNAEGGILDDLIAYRREEGYLLVVNAANVEIDLAAIPEADDVTAGYAMLAVQGPAALSLLGREVAPFTHSVERVLGVECLIAGTGYTGERGCELLCRPEDALGLWDRIVARGAVPCGLGARDILRLEACLPLHGQDLTPQRTPIEAGLGWACALEKEFPGVEILRREVEQGPEVQLVPFVMTERAIPRTGMTILDGGIVTSGGYSPTFEAGIGLGYVRRELAAPGTPITIDVRGRKRAAVVHERPLYRRKETRDGGG